MNIKTVKYERLFPCGAYLNEKIGFEAEVGSVHLLNEELLEHGIHPVRMETPEEVVNKLRQLAEDIHREKYPHFYLPEGTSTIQASFSNEPTVTNIPVINKESERIEIAIDNCTSALEVKLYMEDAYKYGLHEHYIKKLKSFQ